MNKAILNIDIQDFIDSNLNSDITSILLKGTTFPNVETRDLIEQIEAKKKCIKKLPTWFSSLRIYFPNKLNIEQTSSELTANYKSGLINGTSLIDLTGGFGVDCYYFSRRFKELTHCELDKDLSDIVNHNYKALNVSSIRTVAGDGLAFLKKNPDTYDWIYIDPSRRHESKGKVFFLKDCLPNVPECMDLLFERSKNVMIKTSPLLDISIGIQELKFVKAIHVVAVGNEVKELLWILEQHYTGDIQVTTVNLKTVKDEVFTFKFQDESEAVATYSEPLTYLYEPNAAILKSGGFKSVSEILNVLKLHSNTHLYTYDTVIDFPGRRFKIDKMLAYSKSVLKSILPKKANITTRNFPETVVQIRKKFKIKDGGNSYLFFTTNLKNEKIVLVCSKLKNII
ncbi:THUMP-like domain-containing protein [Flavobacteriaceae bacterium LMO-SS05]